MSIVAIQEPAAETELTGATNLMAHYCLEHSYNKFTGKKVSSNIHQCMLHLCFDIH